jgi:hypothetical protein
MISALFLRQNAEVMNKMECKKLQYTIGTVPKYKRKIVKTRAMLVPLAHLCITASFFGLVRGFL